MRELIRSLLSKPIEVALCVGGALLGMLLLVTPEYELALLPPVALLLFLVLGRYPLLGFYSIIFLVPFGAYRGISEKYEFLRIHWILAILLLAVLFFRCLSNRKAAWLLRSNLTPSLLLFITAAFISTLLSPYKGTAMREMAYLAVAFAFFSLNLGFVNYKGFRKIVPAVLIVSVSVGSLIAIRSYLFDKGFPDVGGGEVKSRSLGASTDPNTMSSIIIFSIPLIFYFMTNAARHRIRVLMVFLLAINVGGLVTTFSRGGTLVMILTMIGVFIDHLQELKPKFLGVLFCIAAGLATLFVVLAPESYWARQRSVNDPTDKAIGRRKSYIYLSYDAFKENPLFGTGPNTFYRLYMVSDYARHFAGYEAGPDQYERQAHNTYLEVLVGMGLVGMFMFALVLIRALANFGAAKRNFLLKGDRKMAALVSAYRLSFISGLLYFLLISDLENKYFLLSLALSQVALRLSNDEDAGIV